MMSIPIGWAKAPLIDRNVESIPNNISITLMYGDRTWMDSNAGLILQRRWGNRAQLFTIPNAGHHIYVDNFKRFNQIIIDRKVNVI